MKGIRVTIEIRRVDKEMAMLTYGKLVTLIKNS